MKTKYTKVNWDCLPTVEVTPEELNQLLAETNYEQRYPTEGCRNIVSIRCGEGSYFKKGNLFCIFDEVPLKLIVRSAAVIERHKREGNLNGFEAFKQFLETVKNLLGMPLKQIVGTIPPQLYSSIRACVPSQLCWCGKKDYYTKVFKADVSSAFPFEGTKSLPNFNHYTVVDDFVPPNDRYPFAFYGDGTIAWLEDGQLYSTAFFYELPYSQFYYRKATVDASRLIAEKELETKVAQQYPKTILVEQAEISLAPVFEALYKLKNEGNSTAKAIMNYFIGYCWRKSKPEYAHIAALILARTNLRMMNISLELLRRNQNPILIATDSVAWEGTEQEDLYTTTKSLGAFVLEHKNCELALKSSKAYQIRDGGIISTLWSGMPKAEALTKPFGAVLEANDLPYITIWDEAQHQYKTMEGILEI